MEKSTSATFSKTPRFGVVFPTTQPGLTAEQAKAHVRGIEELGADHLLVADHVIGADPDHHEGWDGAWDNSTPFREPLTFLSFVVGFSTLDIGTYILILPQRQTALVAKQVAEIDLLSGGGRLRLGVAVGWNKVEYDGLGVPFSTRAARIEDQVAALRVLWREHSVDLDVGRERIEGAGINPRPAAGVPIWLGGASEAALNRIGKLADGWMPFPIDDRLDGAAFGAQMDAVASAAREAGREVSTIGLQGVINLSPRMISLVPQIWEDWVKVGATHIAFNTLRSGATSLSEHAGLVESAVGALRDADGFDPSTERTTRSR